MNSKDKLKQVIQDFPNIWKNETAFFTYLRGCLRKAWSTHPVKLELIKKKRYQIPNPNPRGNKPTVWGCDCSMCGKTDVLKNFQVDHAISAGKLNKVEDIQGFVERLLIVGEGDLRMVCKDCNNALALADKQGISYEEAIIRKKVIAMGKNKLPELKKQMEALGIPVGTKDKMLKAYKEKLESESRLDA